MAHPSRGDQVSPVNKPQPPAGFSNLREVFNIFHSPGAISSKCVFDSAAVDTQPGRMVSSCLLIGLSDGCRKFFRSASRRAPGDGDSEGKPHIVPVCFVFANKQVYIALDEKTKRVGALQLQRVRNNQANPKSQSLWMTMKIGASWHGRAPMAWRKFCGAVQATIPPCGC